MSKNKSSDTSIYTNSEKYEQAVKEAEEKCNNATFSKSYNRELFNREKQRLANKYLRR